MSYQASKRRILTVIVLVPCVCSLSCNSNAEYDLSGFERFALRRIITLDVCIDPGSVYEAQMEQSRGAIMFSASLLREVMHPTDANPVAVTDSIAPRALAPDEVARVAEVFGAIGIERMLLPGCLGADPCTITVFAWDDQEYSDFQCDGPSRPLVSESDQAAILALLQELADGPS